METLEDRIARDGPVQELDAVGWAIRLAKRLEALHALGVAHGSISPACVLTLGAERGSKAMLADVQRTESSLAFQSPERITGGDLSPADDTWAVAATLYTALTGSPPFAGVNDADARQKILAASPAPLAVFDVGDDDLQHIIDSAFTRDFGRRLATVGALRRALEEWHPDAEVRKLSPLDEEESTDDGEDADDARTMMRASPFISDSLPLPRRPPAGPAPPAFHAPGPPLQVPPPPPRVQPPPAPAPAPAAAPPAYVQAPPARAVPLANAPDDDDDDEDDDVRTMMRELPEHLMRQVHARPQEGNEVTAPVVAPPPGGRASYPDLAPARAPMPAPHRPIPPPPVSRPGPPAKPLADEDTGEQRTLLKPLSVDDEGDDDDDDGVRTMMREAPAEGWPDKAMAAQQGGLPAVPAPHPPLQQGRPPGFPLAPGPGVGPPFPQAGQGSGPSFPQSPSLGGGPPFPQGQGMGAWPPFPQGQGQGMGAGPPFPQGQGMGAGPPFPQGQGMGAGPPFPQGQGMAPGPGYGPPAGNDFASTQAFPAMSDEPAGAPGHPLPMAGGQRWPQGGPAPSYTVPFPAVQLSDLEMGPPPAPPSPPQPQPGVGYPAGQPSMEMMLQGPMGQMGPAGPMGPGAMGPLVPGASLPRPATGRKGLVIAAVIALLFAAGVTFILLRFRGLLQR